MSNRQLMMMTDLIMDSLTDATVSKNHPWFQNHQTTSESMQPFPETEESSFQMKLMLTPDRHTSLT